MSTRELSTTDGVQSQLAEPPSRPPKVSIAPLTGRVVAGVSVTIRVQIDSGIKWRRVGGEWVDEPAVRYTGVRVSLDGTDIVHAAYERLHDRTAALARGKAFFFRVFYTECMRIVVDHYRKTKNDKGRGKHQRVELQSSFVQDQRLLADFDAIYDVLAELERQDARVGQVAMLKVFENRAVEGKPGATRGLSNTEVAELLGMGLRTVEKDWAFAKAFLLERLGGNPAR